MTAIARYRPARNGSLARSSMDTMLREFFGQTSGENGRTSPSRWMPLVDLYETEDAFLIDMDLPGMKKSDIEVSFENGVLHISGERNDESAEEKPQYHRIERLHGRFTRSIALTTAVQVDKIKANFKDGVLSVEVPKAEELKPVQVKIS